MEEHIKRVSKKNSLEFPVENLKPAKDLDLDLVSFILRRQFKRILMICLDVIFVTINIQITYELISSCYCEKRIIYDFDCEFIED